MSVDERTAGVKGNHADKRRISYKREGDGFLFDAICEDGYTYTIFARNMPALKKYIDKKLSAINSCILFMVDQLQSQYHVCGMVNLFNSARFCKEAFISRNKVMVHGVTRRANRGLPECVVQWEEKTKKKQEQVRGTTKAAVLEGDPECPNLVAFSVYDTKPVHFLTTACTSMKWIEKTKKVWDKDAGINTVLKFLRPTINDEYNNGMNNVDQADQLRGSYRFDRWMRKRKWWWSMWMWGVQVLLVNSYILYKTAHLLIWKTPKKNVLSQYDFRHAIVLRWFEVDGQNESTKRKRPDPAPGPASVSASCTSSTQTGINFKRATCVTDKSLDPLTGSLRGRLDEYPEHYLAECTSVKKPCCSLCRLVEENSNIRNYEGVYCCDQCKVNLCIPCFKLFHTISNVKKLKGEVQKNMENKKNGH